MLGGPGLLVLLLGVPLVLGVRRWVLSR